MNSDVHLTQTSDKVTIREVMGSCGEAFHNQTLNTQDAIDQLSRKFASSGRFLVAERGKDLLGFCAYYANDEVSKVAFLSMIIVRSHAQGTGTGSRLLASAIEDCRSRGMKHLRLEVANDNISAIAFYEKRGFKLEHINAASRNLILDL